MSDATFQVVQYVPGFPDDIRITVGALLNDRNGHFYAIALAPPPGIRGELGGMEAFALQRVVTNIALLKNSDDLVSMCGPCIVTGKLQEVPADVTDPRAWVRRLLHSAVALPPAG